MYCVASIVQSLFRAKGQHYLSALDISQHEDSQQKARLDVISPNTLQHSTPCYICLQFVSVYAAATTATDAATVTAAIEEVWYERRQNEVKLMDKKLIDAVKLIDA